VKVMLQLAAMPAMCVAVCAGFVEAAPQIEATLAEALQTPVEAMSFVEALEQWRFAEA